MGLTAFKASPFKIELVYLLDKIGITFSWFFPHKKEPPFFKNKNTNTKWNHLNYSKQNKVKIINHGSLVNKNPDFFFFFFFKLGV